MLSQNRQHNSQCEHCTLSSACQSERSNGELQLNHMPHRIYHRGETLYSMGSPFSALYILRSGSAKAYFSSYSGEEQISGFYYPGDLIGLDGFDADTHAYSLKFLETSSVCSIGVDEFNKTMGESAVLRKQILKSMSHAILGEQQQLFSVNKYTSEQRLAKFLLDLSNRFQQRGLSGKVFDLSMTRIDIANFLGMAIETISRLLGKLQQEGIIDVQRRQIRLLNKERLNDSLVADEPAFKAVMHRATSRQHSSQLSYA
ncbi:helix-turn-helix domain-containing protein [Alteromonadaceae bacterium BrNp21-10]|nr:helix-turn-helix domain-containing protein [Alteromonadaceae bacterium BrNp21-10]